MNIFYDPQASALTTTLPEAESRHAAKALRLKQGDLIHIVNGKGDLFEATISIPDPKACKIKVLSHQEGFGKRNFSIHIAIAPTKNSDRLEWFVEKCVELGVDKISFLVCRRSERRKLKTNRLERIAVSAMKQSLKGYLPEIIPLRDLDKFLQEDFGDTQKFIAHLEEGYNQHLKGVAAKNSEYVILIGPEGDFTTDEVKNAKTSGFNPVSLGASRLRTETAGISACHILNLINNN